MNWTKTIICSMLLSFAFFMYFGHLVAERWEMWAIDAAAPLIKGLNTQFGMAYARAAGHAIAFLVGVAATMLFIFPLGFVLAQKLKHAAAALLIVAPVLAISMSGVTLSLASIANVLQPLLGAACAVLVFPRNRSAPHTHSAA